MNQEVIDLINKLLKQGKTLEVKNVHGIIQVIELDRKLKIKTPIE